MSHEETKDSRFRTGAKTMFRNGPADTIALCKFGSLCECDPVDVDAELAL